MARKPCPDNPPCPRCGATHIVKNGSKNGRQRWVCRTCNRSFGATCGTPMYRLHNTPTEVARTLLVVMRRGSLSAAEDITGHKHETIGRWLRAAALHAEQITEVLVRDLHLTVVEVDAFWSFVKKSAQRRPCGDRTALGVPKCGARHARCGGVGVCGFRGCGSPAGGAQTRRRTAGHGGVSWVSDGRAVYRQEVGRVYRDAQRLGKRGRPRLVPTAGVGLTQAVKRRCRGRVVGVAVRCVLGSPIECPYVVHGERLNGVLRDRLNGLTRKTHAFAKRVCLWAVVGVLCVFERNWWCLRWCWRARVDGLLDGRRYWRRSPALAIGWTDDIWSWEEFLTDRHHHYSKG
jgi:transposase-like protein